MHTVVDYGKLPEEARRSKAVLDVREWLGHERYEILHEAFMRKQETEGLMSFETFAMLFSISGIQGYPVRALYHAWFDVDPDAPEAQALQGVA